MATLQRLPHSSSCSTASSYGTNSGKPETFPAGLRVLVVDDDITCLRILEQMLRRCSYHATTCSQATVALNLLRERKGCFDLVLSDVHMPDMDGFKLLELVGLEMDLPVIMMSADGKTSAVMRGIRHGACDYLIKPIREEELKNIWQHVVRKKWNETKEQENSGSLDDNDRHKRGSDDAEYASSVNEGSEGMLKTQKKRRDIKEEDDGELENDDPTASKKPRVVWSVELHQQFVSAVNQLGIDKAVPKRILELMNVSGLTRENVASHLQKFRLYLKRLCGVAQQGGIPNSFCGPVEQNPKIGQLGRFDFQTLAASGQIPPQTLAALHAELFGQPTGNLVLPAMDQPTLLQAALQGQKCIPVDPGVAYGEPLMKCPSNISKQFSQPIITIEDVHSSFGTWTSNSLGTVGPISNFTGVAAQNGNMLMSILQNQQQQHQQQIQSALQEDDNNTTSCKDALKSLGIIDMLSCNSGVAHATVPATSDDNTTSKQTLGCKLSGNSEASSNQDSEDDKELLQDTKIGNTISQVPPNASNQNARAGLEIEDRVKDIQDLLRMIGNSSSAQISPPVLTEVTADPNLKMLVNRIGCLLFSWEKKIVQTKLSHATEKGEIRPEPTAILDKRMIKRCNKSVTKVLVHESSNISEDTTQEEWSQLNKAFPDF